MVKITEGTFKIGDLDLYTRTWLPDDGAIKAKLILVHGFSDHCGLYDAFGSALAAAAIGVFGFDQRGWGRSVRKPSDKGLTGGTAQVVSDIAAFVDSHLPSSSSSSSSSEPPVFVLGHSMGGGEVLALAGDPGHRATASRVRGWVLEAPFLGWAPGAEPSALKIRAGRLAARVLPRRQMVHRFAPEDLTRDPATVEVLRADELCHDTGTLEGLAALLDRTDALVRNAVRIDPSVVRGLWLGHGTADKATGYAFSSAWFGAQTALADKTFRTYDGWYHQLHAEPERDVYFGHVIEWVLARVDEVPAVAAAAAAATVGTQAQAAAEGEAQGEGAAEAPGTEAEAKAAADDKPESKL
ncbi:hypothetical protein GGTG_07951 [Gaeumannomyces tritici R3-111a-1]|uniref:Serine aminopeptidase S33 domain-containing protein n=1 Tax=Gaeumannomyces tritici (strain R3-111a-1) TaxID=644352 RepID=J3P361_GAET3|nr:hypothetical protein GGTG_07951 [Gaeumannomyces tritici R3-111a-1]EJT74103.1 hypothetical protein GGTG_07951 [Gaeumannomyces tritici R3-111a-1]